MGGVAAAGGGDGSREAVEISMVCLVKPPVGEQPEED